MSMLAERKRKQKWSLNPRGKEWSQDTNKFGQKMLEKMGWKHGKGLGANEDGITEHVKVSYKNDSKGMGYKESDNQWTEHETNFSALLESLTGTFGQTDDVKLNSLEKKSQTSRVRVHYHKFTRGKDLSRYSEKDLANIFGKKSLKESKKEVTEENSSSSIEKLEKDSKFLLNAGSMKDYFKKKLPNFGKSNGIAIGSNGVLKREESDSESEASPSFSLTNGDVEDSNSYTGFGLKKEVLSGEDSESRNKSEQKQGKATFTSYLNKEEGVVTVQKKKKKKRKTEDYGEDTVLSPKKKPKKSDDKKTKNSVESDLGLSNPGFNPLYTRIKVQRHILTTIEETVYDEASMLEESSTGVVETEVEVYEGKSENVNGALQEGYNNELNYETPKKKNKKRLEDFDAIEVCNSGDKKRSKNKGVADDFSSSNAKDQENGVENSTFDASVEYEECTKNTGSICEVNNQVNNKKKKKKNVFAIDNPNFEGKGQESVNSYQTEDNPYEIKIKKKKNDKLIDESTGCTSAIKSLKVDENPDKPWSIEKKTKEKMALENPSLTLSTENSMDFSQTEESLYEVKRKKKKEKKLALESSSFSGPKENSTDFNRAEENPYEGKRATLAVENPCFENTPDNSVDSSQIEENPYEVKVPEKKKNKKKKCEPLAIENPAFDSATDITDLPPAEVNPFEVCVKENKKKTNRKKEMFAMDNPHFDPNASSEECVDNNKFEVQKKKKVSKKNEGKEGVVNAALNLDASSKVEEDISINIEASDLMLNVVTTPIINRLNVTNSEGAYSISKVNSVKSRKSVRFSDVTEERILPNNDDLRNTNDIKNNTQVLNSSIENENMSNASPAGVVSSCDEASQRKKGKKRKLGFDNMAFDQQKNNLDENVDSIAKTLDRYQAEIENDINEKKLEEFNMDDIMVGEVGNPHGENEKLSEGTKLKFKYAQFVAKTPFYQLGKTGAKKSYKHLIKGDIVVRFNDTNLHEIPGYAVRNKSAVV